MDETYDVPVPEACPRCGHGVTATGIATQYQEDLPTGPADRAGVPRAHRAVPRVWRSRPRPPSAPDLGRARRRAVHGWKVGGRLQWLWAFVTPDTTVYAIQVGRGFEEAATVLGADFEGCLVRDGWAPYRQFTAAAHQTCLTHLLRRCRLLQRDQGDTRLAPQVEHLLRHGLDVRDRWRAGTMSAHGVAVARTARTPAQSADRYADLSRRADLFACHLAIEFPATFMFLVDPAIDATN